MTYTVTWARRTLKQLEKLDRAAQKKIVLLVLVVAVAHRREVYLDPRQAGGHPDQMS